MNNTEYRKYSITVWITGFNGDGRAEQVLIEARSVAEAKDRAAAWFGPVLD